jgi:hypothetical protein
MSETMNWLDANAGGGASSPAAAFNEIGAKVIGKIISQPRVVDTQYGERFVIEIETHDGCTATAEGTPITAGQTVTIWIKQGAMATAVKQACTAAGVAGVSVGDTLAFAYTGDGNQPKPGFNPPKQYGAKLQPSTPSVSVDDLL